MGSSAVRISTQLAISDLRDEDITMRETVGFRTSTSMIFSELLKRDALMFRKIGILGYDVAVNAYDQLLNDQILNDQILVETLSELRWLVEQGIVFDIQMPGTSEDDSVDDETMKLVDDWLKSDERFKGKIEQFVSYLEEKSEREHRTNTYKEGIEPITNLMHEIYSTELFLRPLSTYYRNNKNMDAYPLFFEIYPKLARQSAGVEDVIDITINHLPTPDDSTSWEQIIDFRDDPDTESKFLGFRVWMNEIARAKLTPLEIEQKLEWLLHEYQQHMKLHRMKTNASALETIIVSGAEFAENLAKLQFGKLAKGLFSIRHRKLALLEGELKSPGREIAFISKAQKLFR